MNSKTKSKEEFIQKEIIKKFIKKITFKVTQVLSFSKGTFRKR